MALNRLRQLTYFSRSILDHSHAGRQLLQPYYVTHITSHLESTTNPDPKHTIQNLMAKSQKQVFVFMKGIPKEPACGYSNAVVQILDAYGVDYDSFDVLKDDEVRKAVKVYSNWPTIPQVYVNGNFVGGCDIMIQMHQNGDLDNLFKDTGKDSKDNK